MNITIEKITNRSLTLTSGSLRIELWALSTPYTGGSVTGYVTASKRTNLVNGLTDRMSPNTFFSSITLNQTYTAPPAGFTSFALFLLEYSPVNCTTADSFCIIAYLNYHEVEPPTVPATLTAAPVSSTQINLAWSAATDNVGVATYQVFRGGVLIATVGNVTSYSDLGLAAGTTYSYAVAACDAAANCSTQTPVTTAKTSAPPDTQPPTVPTGLSATAASSSQVNLTWTASTDNVGVSAYRLYSSGNLVVTLGNVTSVSRTNAPSTTYQYTLSACDAAGNCSAQSAATTVTTPAQADTQAPSTPAGLTATVVGGNGINLAWGASIDNVGVTAYKIYRSGSLLITLGNVTGYADAGLRDATTFSYTVQACDAANNCSAQSSTATATTQGGSNTTTSTLSFVTGWNLVGNGSGGTLEVGAAFGDTNKVSTVWKWNAASAKWAFYTPSLAGQALSDYAASKGYEVLNSVGAGQGVWVNAKIPFTAPLSTGTAVISSAFRTMVSGWSLIAIGDNKTPAQFNLALSATQPAAGDIPINLTTLWAWDATLSNWYFYAPSLEKSGGLAAYIVSKGYIDFGSRALTPTMGFWVNKP